MNVGSFIGEWEMRVELWHNGVILVTQDMLQTSYLFWMNWIVPP